MFIRVNKIRQLIKSSKIRVKLCVSNLTHLFLVVKPMTAKVKVIVNKSNEVRVPKLLIDFVLQDAATQFTRQQYLAITELADEFQRINVNR